MSSFVQRSIDFLWAAFAATLIAAAALVTIVRMLLPEIGSQRAAIQEWIAETVGRPAVVGEIKASWSGWSPRISVDKIAFFDPSKSAELVRFDRAVINIAPLGSIVARTLKPKSLILSGVELTLIRHEDGRITVAGMPPPKSPIIVWLIKQNNFAVTEADLNVIDESDGSEIALKDVTLAINSRGEQKRLTGFVDLPESIGRRLTIEYSATGDPLGSEWDGTVNFRLDGFNTEYLNEHLTWQGSPPPKAPTDLVAWTEWKRAKLHKASFELHVDVPHDASAGAADDHALRARGIVHRRPRGWRIDVGEIELPAVAKANQGAHFSAAWHTQGGELRSAVISGSALPVDPIATLVTRLMPLDPSVRKSITQARPRGTLRDLEAAWTRDAEGKTQQFLTSRLEQISADASTEFPGLSGLDARVVWGTRGGLLSFDRADFEVDYEARFPQTLEITKLSGWLSWATAVDGGITAHAHNLDGVISGADLVVNGSLVTHAESSPSVKLIVDVREADATRLHHMLPSGLMPQRGETWSRELFQAGRITSGRAVIRGPVEGFPFDNAEGVFKADFGIADARMQYSRRWPIATDLDGRLSYRGRRVELLVDRGFVTEANIAGAEIVLPNLFTKKRFVRISGTARGPAKSATDIVMASPLKAGKAARLQGIDINGDIEVALDLNLALFRGGPKEVLGLTRFRGNRIEGRQLNVVVENVVGDVSFTRGDWYGEGMTGEFDGMPVGLVMAGGLDDPNYDSEFRLTGTTDAAGLIKYLRRYTPSIHAWLETKDRLGSITGTLPWKSVLTIPTKGVDEAALPRRLAIESSLHGLNVDLPWPFDKLADERKQLRIEMAIKDRIALAARIDYGDTMDVEITSTKTETGRAAVNRIEVLFGSIAPQFKGTPGINVRGYIPMLSLNEWAGYMQGPDSPEGTPFTTLPTSFDIQVKELRMLRRQLEDIRLAGTKAEDHWTVDVSSIDATGQVLIPRDLDNNALQLDLEHLRLVSSPQEKEDEPLELDPTRIPALEFKCATFQFGDTDFGRAEIRTTRLDDGLRLERLNFTNPDFNVSASGNWLIDGQLQTSQLNIDASSRALAPLLDRFGYKVANIEGGETDIQIDATWSGTPADFTLDRLTGTFELHVIDGRFLDIEPGSGRLFGLLSLQTLPRRLSLDFTDIFRKGFAFDRIDGVFELELGNAYTNSLAMDGPAARIDVSGRTGLANKDYDQHVVVTPALSSSLPLAAALFGPIGAGAGAVYYIGGKMFKSIPEQVDKFLTREYSIKGSWENPVVEKI